MQLNRQPATSGATVADRGGGGEGGDAPRLLAGAVFRELLLCDPLLASGRLGRVAAQTSQPRVAENLEKSDGRTGKMLQIHTYRPDTCRDYVERDENHSKLYRYMLWSAVEFE